MKRIKILHLTYDMRIGGTETVIKNLVEGSDSQRFDNEILCIESTLGPFGQQLLDEGIKITCLNWVGGFDLALIKQIRATIKNENVDILHCHQYTPWVYGTLAALFTQVKVIFTEHGRFYPDSSSWKRRIVNPLLLLATAKVTSISKATKQALVDYEFIPQKRIDVVYNGIQGLVSNSRKVHELRERLNIPSNSFVFGTVARLDPIKNQVMMINAFAKVLEEHKAVKLVLVGDGDERQKLETLVDSLGIRSAVFFIGYEAAPVNHIALMDVFLLSSLSEGTSMTLLEAMSLGKPCVVTDAGGNPELIQHEYNGLVSPNDDIRGFAENMKISERNRELVAMMSSNAKLRFSERFERCKMLNQFSDMYISLTEQNPCLS